MGNSRVSCFMTHGVVKFCAKLFHRIRFKRLKKPIILLISSVTVLVNVLI